MNERFIFLYSPRQVQYNGLGQENIQNGSCPLLQILPLVLQSKRIT